MVRTRPGSRKASDTKVFISMALPVSEVSRLPRTGSARTAQVKPLVSCIAWSNKLRAMSLAVWRGGAR
eukprot:14256272-Alexandrium_andersonii.AAC.1